MMLLLTACSQDVSEETYYDYIAPLTDAYGNMVLPLNTTIRLTMKDERLLEETMEELSDIIYEYHMLFDAYHDYEYVTNLKTINDSYGTGQEVAINVELYNLIKEAIEYTKLSEGKFNLTIGSLYNVYEPLFSNIPVVLEDPDISKAKACVVNYEDIDEVIVLGEGQTIRFNEYDGCEEKVQISLGAISKGYITDKAIEYLDSLVYSIKEAYTIDDINEIISEISDNELFKDFFKKSLKSSKNKIHTTLEPQKCIINGFTVFYGKNNKQNDYITFKLAKPNDIWFHVQKMHGTHVLLKPDGKNISNDVILECAKLCKQNSKAKYSLNVAVDYTLAKNVKRHPSKKTGMVLYTNYKTIIV